MGVGEFSPLAHLLRRKLERKVGGSGFDMKLPLHLPLYLLMLLYFFYFFFFVYVYVCGEMLLDYCAASFFLFLFH